MPRECTTLRRAPQPPAVPVGCEEPGRLLQPRPERHDLPDQGSTRCGLLPSPRTATARDVYLRPRDRQAGQEDDAVAPGSPARPVVRSGQSMPPTCSTWLSGTGSPSPFAASDVANRASHPPGFPGGATRSPRLAGIGVAPHRNGNRTEIVVQRTAQLAQAFGIGVNHGRRLPSPEQRGQH